MKKIKEQYPAGDFGIWLVIYMELITFGGLFVSYAFARRGEVELFNDSQLMLSQTSGFINTLILLTSSFFIIKAIAAIKRFDPTVAKEKASLWLLSAMGLGGLFLIIKGLEFMEKYEQGINISTNTFFMFYFIMTIFHFLHVVLGLVILFNIYKNTKRGEYSATEYSGMETGAVYWHLVDLLWIVLFPLVYIMR